MKQISDRAKKLIENLLGWSTAPHEGEWEFDEWGRPIGGFAYVDQAQSELEGYIATLEAEVEALRLCKNQEAQISEMRRVGNLMADHLNALGVSRHDREWADASNLLHETEGRDED